MTTGNGIYEIDNERNELLRQFANALLALWKHHTQIPEGLVRTARTIYNKDNRLKYGGDQSIKKLGKYVIEEDRNFRMQRPFEMKSDAQDLARRYGDLMV